MEDLSLSQDFTFNDLQYGYVVEYRDGQKRLVLNNYLIGTNGCYELSNYKEDMKNQAYSDLDIVRVFKISAQTTLDRLFYIENLNLIWERKATKKMTIEEMQNKLEELTGEKIEIEISNEDKNTAIVKYCAFTHCNICCLNDDTCCTWENDLENTQNIEDCYNKIMEQKE